MLRLGTAQKRLQLLFIFPANVQYLAAAASTLSCILMITCLINDVYHLMTIAIAHELTED
jgi:hypothetical protein